MVRKLKVTKRVADKVPWYERPVLLFSAIGVLLLGAGILMANVTSRNARVPQALGPSSGGATSATPAPGQVDGQAGVVASRILLPPTAALPPLTSGQCAPPLAAETRQEAVTARTRLREARGLAQLTPQAVPGTAAFGDAAVDELVTQAAQAGSPAQIWERLTFKADADRFTDIEVQRDAEGCVYVAGFVARDVGEALGALGPDLELGPAPVVAKPPAWQFWRKSPKPEKLELYQGSVVAIYPDLSPEAECFVVLPLTRARPSGVRTARAALERPLHVLEVTLQ
jgi:hypothetical protein